MAIGVLLHATRCVIPAANPYGQSFRRIRKSASFAKGIALLCANFGGSDDADEFVIVVVVVVEGGRGVQWRRWVSIKEVMLPCEVLVAWDQVM